MADFGSSHCRMKFFILLHQVRHKHEGRRYWECFPPCYFLHFHWVVRSTMALSLLTANGKPPLTLDSNACRLSVDSTLSKDNTRQRFPLTGRRRPCWGSLSDGRRAEKSRCHREQLLRPTAMTSPSKSCIETIGGSKLGSSQLSRGQRRWRHVVVIDHQSQQFQECTGYHSGWTSQPVACQRRMTTHIFTSSANVFLSFQNQTEVSRRCLTESGWKAWPEMCSLIHRMTSEQGNILVRLLPPLTPNHISSFSEVGGRRREEKLGASHQRKTEP